MLKAIFAKHVNKGDEILVSGGSRISVLNVEHRGSDVRIYVEGGYLTYDQYCIVGLCHRPVPQVKQSETIAVLEMAITSVVGENVTIKNPERLPLLLSTLVGWELSKLPDNQG